MLEDQVVVHQVFLENQVLDLDLKVGDIILRVDGEDIKERLFRLSKLFSSSSDYTRDVKLFQYLLTKEASSVAILSLRRIVPHVGDVVQGQETVTLSIEKEVEVLRNAVPQKLQKTSTIPPYATLDKIDKSGKQIGYIDLRNLHNQHVPDAMENVKNTGSVIFDLRGYTKGAGYRIARYLTKKRVTSCMSITPFFMPSLLVDGTEPTMNVSNQSCTPGDPAPYYSGRVVCLIDNNTISHGELTCLFLQSCRPDLVVIGTPTTATLGSVTNVILPGNVEVGFVGLGYLPPDGSKSRGIIPDVAVQETIAGLILEKDEILDQAISYLQME